MNPLMNGLPILNASIYWQLWTDSNYGVDKSWRTTKCDYDLWLWDKTSHGITQIEILSIKLERRGTGKNLTPLNSL